MASEAAESGWEAKFHRHFGSNEIHRDGGPECTQPGKPREVYVFDPDYLAAHDREVAAKALEEAANEWGAFEPNWKSSQMDYWLRARAAEYRNPEGSEG